MGKESDTSGTGKPLGIAWYRKEQWTTLLEMSADCEGLQKTYDQWLLGAEKAVKKLKVQGCHIVKIDVDVIHMTTWCIIQGIPVNAASRSKYVNHQMQRDRA